METYLRDLAFRQSEQSMQANLRVRPSVLLREHPQR